MELYEDELRECKIEQFDESENWSFVFLNHYFLMT